MIRPKGGHVVCYFKPRKSRDLDFMLRFEVKLLKVEIKEEGCCLSLKAIEPIYCCSGDVLSTFKTVNMMQSNRQRINKNTK